MLHSGVFLRLGPRRQITATWRRSATLVGTAARSCTAAAVTTEAVSPQVRNMHRLSSPRKPITAIVPNARSPAAVWGSLQRRHMAAVNLERDPRYKKIGSEDVKYFRSVLEPRSVLATKELGGTADIEDLDGYNTDWLGKYKGNSQVVLRPKSTEQVSKVLEYCNRERIAVVPQGGNTGLVGGSVPVFDEVIISLASMNKVRSFNNASGILVCDSGCILEELDNYVRQHGYVIPLDLGAKGSCQIGGNVSTNAGGIRFLRYGSLHGSVLGIEAVLPDGTIIDNLTTLPKDSTGYDMKQLFIGAEGSLGIVTGVSIMTPPKPTATNVAVLGVPDYQSVQKAFRHVRRDLGEILSAFEFWDARCMQTVLGHHQLRNPLSSEFSFYVLVETSGSKVEHDDEKLALCLERLMEDGVVEDGALAQDETQISKMWSMREGIPESLSKWGPTYKYDISIPLPVLYDIVTDIKARLQSAGLYLQADDNGGDHSSGSDGKAAASVADDTPPVVKGVLGYGHIGDGNLHLNIVANRFDPAITQVLEPYIYEWVSSHRGSISAEHGLGLMKAPHLHYSKPAPLVKWMKQTKNAVDPNGIMNPYKFLPRD